jgi:hypothetical protein
VLCASRSSNACGPGPNQFSAPFIPNEPRRFSKSQKPANRVFAVPGGSKILSERLLFGSTVRSNLRSIFRIGLRLLLVKLDISSPSPAFQTASNFIKSSHPTLARRANSVNITQHLIPRGLPTASETSTMYVNIEFSSTSSQRIVRM